MYERGIKENGGKKMNFMEAVQAMKEGKKVRKESISNTEYHFFIINGTGRIQYQATMTSGNEDYSFNLSDIEATDWEIFEEKKTLSDTIYCAQCGTINKCGCGQFKREVLNPAPVKQAIKDIKSKFREHGFINEQVFDIINKVVGKRLIQD